MSIKSLLTEPSKTMPPKIAYGFLVFFIVLLLFAIWNTYTASPQQRHNTYGTFSIWIRASEIGLLSTNSIRWASVITELKNFSSPLAVL